MNAANSQTGNQTGSSIAPGRRFTWPVAAYGVSTCGNYLNLVALALFTYEVTGSGLGVGLLAALRLVTGSLAGFAAGALAERFDRRRLMIGADLAQLVAMTVLAATTRAADVVVLGCAVAVLGAGNSLFTVALRSAVPDMVGEAARVRANGLLVTAKSVAMVCGFAGAGPLIGIGGFPAAFAFNAATFAVSAVALALIRFRAHDPAAVAPATGEAGARATLAGVAPVVLLMLVLRGVDAFASSSHNTALPVFAATTRPDGAATFMSYFWVAWAVGVLSAHRVVTRWGGLGTAHRLQRAFGLATCAMAVSFTLAFTGLPDIAMAIVVLVAGLADGVTEIAYVSRLQEAPDHLRTRLFGLSATIETSGFALGMAAAGALLEVLPALAVVALLHGLALCAATAFLLFTTRSSAPGSSGGTRRRERAREHHLPRS
ncbi:putative MFS family arabinose efflux permease [Saccharothrix carnea]|uniref:Putative MFS family arabinose efflux permease n=1 Tax=Saccharothrix carnea TaxID=1280637 RepID=A0A2P8I0V8_SACCR|nr:MFS transporter [Saccharothrix carnea]PSL52118.1 putative MFS family arabinose efflux permease [Saccharothrix carnea]